MKAKGVFTVLKATSGDARLLSPVDERAKAILLKLELGKKVLCWAHTARYPDHHRFAFAVLQRIAEAKGIPVEHVLLWIKRETGRFDWVRLPDGSTTLAPHSIAFESMSQEEFQSFWTDAMDVIREQILPGADPKLFAELREMLAGKVD